MYTLHVKWGLRLNKNSNYNPCQKSLGHLAETRAELYIYENCLAYKNNNNYYFIQQQLLIFIKANKEIAILIYPQIAYLVNEKNRNEEKRS